MRGHILSDPPDVSFFRVCLRCRRAFALKLIKKHVDEKVGKLRTYRCKHCGAEETYAQRLPPHVV